MKRKPDTFLLIVLLPSFRWLQVLRLWTSVPRLLSQETIWISTFPFAKKINFLKDVNVIRHISQTHKQPKYPSTEEQIKMWYIHTMEYWKWSRSVAQSCLTLCNPMDYSLPGSSIHGILQARILEWVAISFSNNGILLSHKKEWSNAIFSNMNATGDDHTKGSKSEISFLT